MSDNLLHPEEGMVVTGPTDREWCLILSSALAWSVGRFEGMGQSPGYAGEVLDQWRYPRRILVGTEEVPTEGETP